jgi:regulator of replication initiation timing
MNEKRFTYEYNEYTGNLFDNKMNTFYHIEDSDENIEVLCDRLNWLVEENEQLKHDATVLIQANQDYRRENEKLKQYIYDNLDKDICDVCSYQYLEKSQMDKYYVAKCKKGYDNCSKGTVIHCKDFKFKELKE